MHTKVPIKISHEIKSNVKNIKKNIKETWENWWNNSFGVFIFLCVIKRMIFESHIGIKKDIIILIISTGNPTTHSGMSLNTSYNKIEIPLNFLKITSSWW